MPTISNLPPVTTASNTLVFPVLDVSVQPGTTSKITLAQITDYIAANGVGDSNGYTGSRGDPGLGFTGSTGFTGSQGIQGFTGSAGALGTKGFTGSVGFTGSQGVGFTGSASNIPGFIGSQGYTGSKGDTGMGFIIAKIYPSVAALQADTAPTSIVAGQFALVDTANADDPDNSRLYLWNGSAYSYVTDLSGSQGITGPQGAIGYTGSQGDVGFIGSVGYTGSNGATGFTGSTGYTGSQGDVGFIGSQGYYGSQGYTGSAGISNSVSKVGQFSFNTTGTVTITGIGFTPKKLELLAFVPGTGVNQSNAVIDSSGACLCQTVMITTSTVYTASMTDSAVYLIDSGLVPTADASFSEYTTDGFTVEVNVATVIANVRYVASS